MAKRNQSAAQLANLEKGVNTRFNGESAVRAQRKAQEAKKRYRPLKEVAKEEITPEDWLEIIRSIKQNAIDTGDVRSAEFLRDSIGEKPTEHVEAEAGVTFGFDDSVDPSWLV